MNNTIKDLMNSETLVQHIVEDLEDFAEDTPVTYEVWVIGYDLDENITDFCLLLNESEDPDKAVDFANKVTLSDITVKDTNILEKLSYISVEVETVVEDEEYFMNVGTIFRKSIPVAEDISGEFEIVHLKETDYTLDENGNLIIPCVQLNHFNKNDRIKIMFDDEEHTPILTYDIISKTTDNDFICEFQY